MTQVQTMTDSELNRALAELMGYTVVQTHDVIDGGGAAWYRLVGPNFGGRYDRDADNAWKSVPDYCTDPAASLEVQTAAISKDAEKYVRNLAIIKWGDAVDPEEVADWPCINVQAVGDLLNATPRERAEAAYITLSQAQKSKGADQLDL